VTGRLLIYGLETALRAEVTNAFVLPGSIGLELTGDVREPLPFANGCSHGNPDAAGQGIANDRIAGGGEPAFDTGVYYLE
jgi:hypothetical protein